MKYLHNTTFDLKCHSQQRFTFYISPHTVGAYNALIFSQYIFFSYVFWSSELCNKWNSKIGFFSPICHSFTQNKSILKQTITSTQVHNMYNMEILRTYKNVDLVMV